MSDHVDGPRSIGDPAADLTDLFAFTNPQDSRRMVLGACVFPSAGEDAMFSNVIDYAIAEANPQGGKVVLLGYSFGVPSVGRALYLLGEEASHKVRRTVFMSPVYNLLPGPGGVPVQFDVPTEEEDLSELERSTSFPLALGTIGTWAGVGARDGFCTGRITPDIVSQFWTQIMNLDPLAKTWGGNIANEYDQNGDITKVNATGLLRSPTFSRNGWNAEVAGTLTIPALLLHGVEDTASPLGNSDNLYNALTSVTDKVMVKVECSSHQFNVESCSGTRCDDGNDATTPYGQEDSIWGGPHTTIAAALIEWVKNGTFEDTKCGQFQVNSSGIANAVASCPAP